MTEQDVREVFLWGVEVAAAWFWTTPRLDDAEEMLDRFFDSLKAEAWDEGYKNGYRDRRLEASYEPGTNPYRAESWCLT